MREANPLRLTDTQTLVEFLEQQPSDSVLSFEDIYKATGVPMEEAGKICVRRACKRLKLEYYPTRSIGIKLAGMETAMPIIAKRGRRIRAGVKQGLKSYKNLIPHIPQLPEQERKYLNLQLGLFGAMDLTLNMGRLDIRNNQGIVPTVVHIALPSMT
jgi:hypothetical protein